MFVPCVSHLLYDKKAHTVFSFYTVKSEKQHQMNCMHGLTLKIVLLA